MNQGIRNAGFGIVLFALLLGIVHLFGIEMFDLYIGSLWQTPHIDCDSSMGLNA